MSLFEIVVILLVLFPVVPCAAIYGTWLLADLLTSKPDLIIVP